MRLGKSPTKRWAAVFGVIAGCSPSCLLAATYSTLYLFQGGADGASPSAGLIYVNGKFYGTTVAGGTYNGGTAFSVMSSGVETNLHSFGQVTAQNCSCDGANPYAELIYVRGKFYGTTVAGGRLGNAGSGPGTVFEMSSDGSERVLYDFDFGEGEFFGSYAPLTWFNGALYGSTEQGGTEPEIYDVGVVFKLTLNGQATVAYSFTGNGGYGDGTTDAAVPYAQLVDVNGTL